MQQLYGPEWVMRLYFQVPQDSPKRAELCQLACQNINFELCDIERNPTYGNLSQVYPLNWRFLPSVDSQVDLLLGKL